MELTVEGGANKRRVSPGVSPGGSPTQKSPSGAGSGFTPLRPRTVAQLQVENVNFNNRRRFSVSAEPMDPNESHNPGERVVIPKTPEVAMQIFNACSNNLLFRNLEKEQRMEIFDAMFERKCAPDETVIRQGEEGDNFYVIDSGVFDVYISKDGQPAKKVVELGPGDSFGELALMYSQPRAATVKARTEAVLWAVDRVTFRRILMDTTSRKRRKYESFLEKVPLLESLTKPERVKVADALESVEFDDEPIVEQGDVGQNFYIIEDGKAIVTKDESDEVLNELGPGDYFGEIALLTDQPRAATVTAVGQVKCLVLSKQAFIRLLGPCTDILKRNVNTYKKLAPGVLEAVQRTQAQA
eukprot:comp22068_c2_seq1/m.32138 comp22068_c2_seq1/g.32138  ORF comp22068_c2_seq1/g.32138 comp22068_c2_seq1/m.32138 type:complete len:355 (-) comp22068_c2_seq1:787-1851(-)